MSTSKSCKTYPKQCYEILELLHKTPDKPLILPFSSLKAAHKFRMLFNSFKKLGMSEEEKLYEMFPEMAAITVRLIKEPPQLVVEHTDYTTDMMQIDEALKSYKG